MEKYVISRNERGLPIIVPLTALNVEHQLGMPISELPADIPLDAIVSVSVDAPSIEDRYGNDLKKIKKIKPTTVVLYINKQGDLNSACKVGNKWVYRLTSSNDIFEKTKKIGEYRRKKLYV